MKNHYGTHTDILTYSDLAEDNATRVCFLDFQEVELTFNFKT